MGMTEPRSIPNITLTATPDRVCDAESVDLFTVTGRGVHNPEYNHRVRRFGNTLLLSAIPTVISLATRGGPAPTVHAVEIWATVTVDGRTYTITPRPCADPILIETTPTAMQQDTAWAESRGLPSRMGLEHIAPATVRNAVGEDQADAIREHIARGHRDPASPHADCSCAQSVYRCYECRRDMGLVPSGTPLERALDYPGRPAVIVVQDCIDTLRGMLKPDPFNGPQYQAYQEALQDAVRALGGEV
jgi:hypothetical protein